MSVLDHLRNQLQSRAKALIIGIPSFEGGKATGLKYSTEYFERESKKLDKTDFHRMNARVAFLVLSDPRLEAYILDTLVPEIIDSVIEESWDASGLKNEEAEQAKNDAAVANGTKAVKSAAKSPVKKTTAKKPAAKKATATAKKATAKKPTARRTTRATK